MNNEKFCRWLSEVAVWSRTTKTSNFRKLLLVSLSLLTTACGGNSGTTSAPPAVVDTRNSTITPDTRSFAITLKAIAVENTANSAAITVNGIPLQGQLQN